MSPQVESWVTLAIQVPLVGLFIYFSIVMIDRFLKAITEITRSFSESVQAINKTFVDSSDKRDTAWRDFFNQQREANNLSIQAMAQRFADEIRVQGKEVAELRAQLRE